LGSPLDSLDALMATIAPSASIGDLIQHGPAPGMDAAGPIPNAPAGMDPLSLLQLLSSDAAQRRTPAAGVPTIRPTTAPTTKSAPIVVAPPGDTATTPPGKFDWPALIKLAAPILGSIASRGDHGAFWTSYLHAQEGADQEKALKEAAAQKLRDAGADFSLRVADHAQGITDPVDYQNFLHIADLAGVKAGYTKPGELASQLTFPASKAADARLKEFTTFMDGAKKTYGEKALYDMVEANPETTYRFKDGKEMNLADALRVFNPLHDASGKAIAPPAADKRGDKLERVTVNGKTVFASWDPDTRKWFDAAGKPLVGVEPEPTVTAPRDEYNQHLNTIIGVWKDAHPGQELPLSVRSQLEIKAKTDFPTAAEAAKANAPAIQIKAGTKEYRVAQDLAYGRLTMAQFRSLYSYSRDVGMRTAIYELAGELNPAFNPAAFEMGYTLAKNPKVQQQLASMDNVREAVPDLLAASDAAKRSGITALNSYTSPIRVAIGSRTFSNLRIARTAFADELSGALGFGSATDMSRQMGFDMTDPNLSPENFRSGIQDIVIPFVERKRATLLKQMGPYGQPGVNPAAEAPVKQKIGRFDVEVAP
jgi:hypothetical protein